MDTGYRALSSLSDVALVARVGKLAARERQSTADLVEALAELDARKLYLSAGCSSLFTYCTQVLHLSEHAAYGRIEAARCARKFPGVLPRLADGSLTLTAISLLAPVMNGDNATTLLAAARHKSKRDVEHLVAEVRPSPPVAATVRKLPSGTSVPNVDPTEQTTEASFSAQPTPAAIHSEVAASLPARRPQIHPLAAAIYKVQFTLSREGHDNLRRAQDLLRHTIPNADVAAIFERALQLLVERLEKRKVAITSRPRPAPVVKTAATIRSRHIPAAIRRDVWHRDAGRCAYVGTAGRCTERGFLEFHHCIPFADGGETSVANLQLRCRAHNQYEAHMWLGIEKDRPPGHASG